MKIDAASSGRWFDGWRIDAPGNDEIAGPREVAKARSWLLSTGWMKWGLIDPAEVPGKRVRSAA